MSTVCLLPERARIELGLPRDCGIFVPSGYYWIIEESDIRKCDPSKANLLFGEERLSDDDFWGVPE